MKKIRFSWQQTSVQIQDFPATFFFDTKIRLSPCWLVISIIFPLISEMSSIFFFPWSFQWWMILHHILVASSSHYTCMHACMHACMYAYIHIYIYIIYNIVNLLIYVFIYIYIPGVRYYGFSPGDLRRCGGAHLRPHPAAAGEGGLALRAQGPALAHGGQVPNGAVGRMLDFRPVFFQDFIQGGAP